MYIYSVNQELTVPEWLRDLSMILERSIPLLVERIFIYFVDLLCYSEFHAIKRSSGIDVLAL